MNALRFQRVANPATHPADIISRPSTAVRVVGFTGFVFAILQSVCAAVFVISGLRLVIGLSALAAAAGTYAPAAGFHQDLIRVPMLILGGVGALVNLTVLLRVWRLRARTSARWRRRAIPRKERRSELIQFALALLTLLLIAAEIVTHPMIHREVIHRKSDSQVKSAQQFQRASMLLQRQLKSYANLPQASGLICREGVHYIPMESQKHVHRL